MGLRVFEDEACRPPYPALSYQQVRSPAYSTGSADGLASAMHTIASGDLIGWCWRPMVCKDAPQVRRREDDG